MVAKRYTVCELCTPMIVNDDWTGHSELCDCDGEECDTLQAEQASADAMGNASLERPVTSGRGYFLCWVCGLDSIGGNVFVRD